MKYAALIADIVDSRKYKDRLLVQKLLKSSLELLNHWFSDSMQAKMVISSGDETQGLFNDACSSYMYYRLLSMLLYPVKIRAGLSFGKLDYTEDWNSNELDGPVYHHAKEALIFCKEENYEIIMYSNKSDDKYINMLLNMTKNIGRSNTMVLNLIQIFSEVLYPLNANIKLSNMGLIKEIIEYKNLIYDKAINKNTNKLSDQVNYEILKKHLEERPFINDKNDKMILMSYWKKGFSTKVADILGIARQIVDRNYNYLNYPNLRNLEATIISFLKEYYVEE
jgi:hypothetical protein